MVPRPGRGQVSKVLAAEQGIIILGTPLGHDEFVRRQLELKSREHELLLSRSPSLADLQSAWALLLNCACSSVTHLLRVIRLDLVRHFAERHDESIWTCRCQILGMHNDESDGVPKQTAPSLFRLEFWICAVEFAPVFLLTGPVGEIVWA